MTPTEIILLSLYLSGFAAFGITLAVVSWWTGRKEHRGELRVPSKK